MAIIVEETKFTKAEARINKPAPQYKDLTKREWCEWGEGMRRLKNNGYVNPNSLSLKEMREVIRSTEMCSVYRAAYAMRG